MNGGASARVGCYGKLPVHREYLRFGLGSAAAGWVVERIDKAHEALSAAASADTDDPPATFAFVARLANGGDAVAGVMRQSSDGMRKHPVAAFVEVAGRELDTAAPATPIALADGWQAMTRLLDRSWATLDELTAALDTAPPTAFDTAADTYREQAKSTPPGRPWRFLTGAEGAAASHIAANLLTIAAAQRNSSSPQDAVALSVVLPDDDGRALRASAWLDVLTAAAGSAPPAIFIGGSPARLYAFYRSIDGTDVAELLAGRQPPVDDLGEEWQALPAPDSAAAAVLERIVAASGSVADLASAVREGAR